MAQLFVTHVRMEGVMSEGSDVEAVVWVLGDMTRVAGAQTHLPASWELRQGLDISRAQDDALVLLVCPDVDEVAILDRQLLRRPQLVVLLDESSSAATVAAVLEAGADMCVRTNSSAILASHLMACRRRLVRTSAPRRASSP
jgi:hypothetical protein